MAPTGLHGRVGLKARINLIVVKLNLIEARLLVSVRLFTCRFALAVVQLCVHSRGDDGSFVVRRRACLLAYEVHLRSKQG